MLASLGTLTVFIFVAYCHGAEIYGNKKIPESTLKSLFERDIDRMETIDISSLKELNKDKKRGLSPTELSLSAFGEDYQLQVTKPQPVLHPEVMIVTRNDDGDQEWKGVIPDCFLVGHVTSHNGTASLSHCEGLKGSITTQSGDFQLRELPKVHNKGLNFSDEDTVLLIGKTRPQNNIDGASLKNDDFSLSALDDQEGKLKNEYRRQTTSKDVVIELAVYTDKEYTELLHQKETAKRIELMILKYNGVQFEYSRPELGYNVKLQIKYLSFWETNPPSYNNSIRVNFALHTFCEIVYDSPIKYDIFYLHSGRRPTDVEGRAWLNGACQRTKCGVDRSEVVSHGSTTHELGHMLGMRHDEALGCTGSDKGVMGGQGTGWSSCSIRDFDKFLQNENAQCLFREDVSNSANYGPIEPVLMGQKYSADEICELNYGPNFHYRNFSYLPPCDIIYSCVDHNEGELFGRMFTQYIGGPQGIYCGTGKICLYRTCQTFAEAKVKPGVVRPGGWGPWTDWKPCSRTCGTGLTYRRRFCNSPSPLNHPGCEGGDDNGYEARTCNPEPCPNDSSDMNTLINQRASETCSRLLKNKVLDSTKYTSVGRNMGLHGHLKCEVQCESVPGYRTYSYDRFGLIPQGTPCEGPIEGQDKIWSEYSYRCLDGYCRFFGCNGELNAKYDVCGVCKGDGSTCYVVKGFYTETTAKHIRKKITEIPVGAINIRFWFDWAVMRDNYLEIHNKDGRIILSSVQQLIWFTTNNPTNFAGTYWMFAYNRQELYARGPLTEPVIIKHYRYGDKKNTGINYTYSVPKSAKTCQGQCANGGTFNTKICSCDCPSGFYGNDCTSRCNTYCFNGTTVDQSNCACQCKEHQTGSQCKCEAGYGGEDCKTKL